MKKLVILFVLFLFGCATDVAISKAPDKVVASKLAKAEQVCKAHGGVKTVSIRTSGARCNDGVSIDWYKYASDGTWGL